MTSFQISARNRANAQKSTGPKTAQGKSVVANNARRHGATARPDPQSVAAWLAIICDNPDIRPDELLSDRDVGFRALALAESEARLIAARKALQDSETDRAETHDQEREMQDLVGMIFGGSGSDSAATSISPQALGNLKQMLRLSIETAKSNRKNLRLLKRYLAEAQAQRRKAFRAWIACKREAA